MKKSMLRDEHHYEQWTHAFSRSTALWDQDKDCIHKRIDDDGRVI